LFGPPEKILIAVVAANVAYSKNDALTLIALAELPRLVHLAEHMKTHFVQRAVIHFVQVLCFGAAEQVISGVERCVRLLVPTILWPGPSETRLDDG
jgi:hypothetical protein